MAFYLILAISFLVILISYNFLSHDKLSKFKGPWLASITDVWLFWYHSDYRKEPLVDIHQKYGKVVRIAPNKLSFGSSGAIRDIYSVSQDLPKSERYLLNGATFNGIQVANLFSSLDKRYHDNIKRAIHKHFTPEATRVYEPTIARATHLLISQIQQRFADKSGLDGVFDLGVWSQYFALDSISDIAFGEPYGCMKNGRDEMDSMTYTQWFSAYCLQIGPMPWLDSLLLKNPVLLWLNSLGIGETRLKVVDHAFQHQINREKELADGADWREDLLDKFLQSKRQHPDVINHEEVDKLAMIIVLAGADTTAGLLGGVFRYLLKNPQVYAKLQAEIDATEDFSYSDTARTPYLDAVIKEAGRIFPAVRFAFERITPPAGMMIDGVAVPGNTNVSVNAWASQRDPAVWGDNADEFDPERWMDPEKNRLMTPKLLLFGSGKFSCVGLHIAYREIYKVVPNLLKKFKLELVDETTDWKWGKAEIVLISGLNVRATSR